MSNDLRVSGPFDLTPQRALHVGASAAITRIIAGACMVWIAAEHAGLLRSPAEKILMSSVPLVIYSIVLSQFKLDPDDAYRRSQAGGRHLTPAEVFSPESDSDDDLERVPALSSGSVNMSDSRQLTNNSVCNLPGIMLDLGGRVSIYFSALIMALNLAVLLPQPLRSERKLCEELNGWWVIYLFAFLLFVFPSWFFYVPRRKELPKDLVKAIREPSEGSSRKRVLLLSVIVQASVALAVYMISDFYAKKAQNLLWSQGAFEGEEVKHGHLTNTSCIDPFVNGTASRSATARDGSLAFSLAVLVWSSAISQSLATHEQIKTLCCVASTKTTKHWCNTDGVYGGLLGWCRGGRQVMPSCNYRQIKEVAVTVGMGGYKLLDLFMAYVAIGVGIGELAGQKGARSMSDLHGALAVAAWILLLVFGVFDDAFMWKPKLKEPVHAFANSEDSPLINNEQGRSFLSLLKEAFRPAADTAVGHTEASSMVVGGSSDTLFADAGRATEEATTAVVEHPQRPPNSLSASTSV